MIKYNKFSLLKEETAEKIRFFVENLKSPLKHIQGASLKLIRSQTKASSAARPRRGTQLLSRFAVTLLLAVTGVFSRRKAIVYDERTLDIVTISYKDWKRWPIQRAELARPKVRRRVSSIALYVNECRSRKSATKARSVKPFSNI